MAVRIKRFLRRFNITVLCLMAFHILVTLLFGWLFDSLLYYCNWYALIYAIGFVCEQLCIVATEQETKPVRRMRIFSAIFAVCSIPYVLFSHGSSWYTILLVGVWSLWLWVEACEMAPEKKAQNITNCVLTVIYVLHTALELQQHYVRHIANGWETDLVAVVPSYAWWRLLNYLPWGIFINMAFIAVRAYRNIPDD